MRYGTHITTALWILIALSVFLMGFYLSTLIGIMHDYIGGIDAL
jgi:hypothetical protein